MWVLHQSDRALIWHARRWPNASTTKCRADVRLHVIATSETEPVAIPPAVICLRCRKSVAEEAKWAAAGMPTRKV